MGLFGKKRPEKRANYRVGVRSQAPLAAVLVRGERVVPTHLVDVSATGCGLRCEASELEGLESGDSLDLRFTAQGIGRPITATAIVRRFTTEEGTATLGLQFEDLEALHAQLNPKLWTFFNRREGFRVTPMLGPGRLVPVRLVLPGGDREELLNDMSAIGLALRVSKAKAFEVKRPCRAVLTLPGREDPFDLGLLPIHHTLTPASLRLGFAMDPRTTREFEQRNYDLTKYLLDAQRQMLQREWG